MRSLKYRLGQFFFVIGLMLLVIFFFQGQNPYPLFFFAGVAGIVLGFYLMRQTRTPSDHSEPPERFRTVRKMMQKSKKR